jgi:putative ABC transport system permease protein
MRMHGRLVLWSLRHRRWRHVLQVLTMAVTIAVVMLFVSVVTELAAFSKTSPANNLQRILVWPKLAQAGNNGLPVSLTATFERIEGVKVAQCQQAIFARHESGATYSINGEQHSGVELNVDFFPVEPDVIEAWKKDRIAGIVSEATAAELNLKVGQTAEIPTPNGPLLIKVVGLSRGALFPHRIAVHLEYLQEHTKNYGLCSYRVFTSPSDFDRVAREIIERTANTPTPAQAFSDSEFMGDWVRRVSVVPALLGFLGVFLLLTTALTLANNTAIAVRERRIEMATLRVLGYRRRTIAITILAESALIGLVGGVIAIAVTWLAVGDGVQLTPGIARLLQDVTLTPFSMGCGLVISVMIPVAGALPAAIASIRTPLVDALRDAA